MARWGLSIEHRILAVSKFDWIDFAESDFPTLIDWQYRIRLSIWLIHSFLDMKYWILATGQGAYNGDQTDRYKVWVTRFDRMALWSGCCAFQYILGMWEWPPFNQLMYLNWDDYRHFKIKCSTEIHVLEITWIPRRKVRTSLKKRLLLWPFDHLNCFQLLDRKPSSRWLTLKPGNLEEIDVVVCASLVDNVQTLVWFGPKTEEFPWRESCILDNTKTAWCWVGRMKKINETNFILQELTVDVVGYDQWDSFLYSFKASNLPWASNPSDASSCFLKSPCKAIIFMIWYVIQQCATCICYSWWYCVALYHITLSHLLCLAGFLSHHGKRGEDIRFPTWQDWSEHQRRCWVVGAPGLAYEHSFLDVLRSRELYDSWS